MTTLDSPSGRPPPLPNTVVLQSYVAKLKLARIERQQAAAVSMRKPTLVTCVGLMVAVALAILDAPEIRPHHHFLEGGGITYLSALDSGDAATNAPRAWPSASSRGNSSDCGAEAPFASVEQAQSENDPGP